MIFRPFLHGIYDWLKEDNNDEDVVSAKTLLGLFGYGKGATGASCFADQEFIDDIRTFQKDNGLKVDGVIAPGGETEHTFGKLLDEKIGVLSEDIKDWEDIDDSWGETEHEKRCAYNYLEVDLPSCAGVERAAKRRAPRGKHVRAGDACREAAFARYTACLRDRPEDNRPPLPWLDY